MLRQIILWIVHAWIQWGIDTFLQPFVWQDLSFPQNTTSVHYNLEKKNLMYGRGACRRTRRWPRGWERWTVVVGCLFFPLLPSPTRPPSSSKTPSSPTPRTPANGDPNIDNVLFSLSRKSLAALQMMARTNSSSQVRSAGQAPTWWGCCRKFTFFSFFSAGPNSMTHLATHPVASGLVNMSEIAEELTMVIGCSEK